MYIYLVTYIDNKGCITSNKVKASNAEEAELIVENHSDCITVINAVPVDD